ncbi:MAG: hypothetical protein EOP48_28815, partial [Sphingobacteriales bacterium]
KQQIDTCLDRIRKAADQCTDLDGFIIFNSMGGGTGSGFGSLLIERLSTDYGKKSKLSIPVYPSANSSTSVVEPYNAILATRYQMDHINVATLMENDALSNICTKQLQIEKPDYGNMNHMAAHMVSGMTGGMRLDGCCLNEDFKAIETNLVPHPPLHFTFASYAPFVSEGVANKGTNSVEITNSLFTANFMSIKCDPNQGKYLATSIQYRGDYVPKNICPAICNLKMNRLVKFVDWCPTGFKCGILYNPPLVISGSKIRAEKRAACLWANSSAISQVFSRNAEEFDKMFNNRAFLHWYLNEGMEEEELRDSRERLTQLLLEYREAEREEDQEAQETGRLRNAF